MNVTKPDYQITKLKSETIEIVNVYRSAGVDNKTFLADLCSMLTPNKQTLIMGDFNICYKKEENNNVFGKLRSLGFKQLVKHSTHIEGGQIDQVFHYCPNRDNQFEVEQQAQYYTDHDLIKVVKGN